MESESYDFLLSCVFSLHRLQVWDLFVSAVLFSLEYLIVSSFWYLLFGYINSSHFRHVLFFLHSRHGFYTPDTAPDGIGDAGLRIMRSRNLSAASRRGGRRG